MIIRPSAALLAAPLLALSEGMAQAHTGVGQTTAFTHGLLHPIGGLDHLLAMVMVGVFAAQLGGRSIGMVPAGFVAAMVVGGMLGIANTSMPFVEIGIGLSVVLLGAMVASKVRATMLLAMSMVGSFAIFHGFAHGTEVPEKASALSYGAGFILATASLLAAGVGLGRIVGQWRGTYGPMCIRAVGAMVAVAGTAIMSGVI